MKQWSRFAPYALVACVCVGIWAALAVKTRAFDFAAQERLLGTLRELRQTESDWDADLLRARLGLDGNYDRVAGSVSRLDALRARLAAGSARLWSGYPGSQARLQALQAQYARLMDEKIGTVEQIEAHNAILSNSTRFFPVAAAELERTVREDEAGVSLLARINVETVLNNLLTDWYQYANTTDPQARGRILEHSDQLGRLAGTLSPAVGAQTQTLLAHVRALLEQQETSARLLAGWSRIDTAGAIDALGQGYRREQAARRTAQRWYLGALIVYSACLAALLAWAGWRAARSNQRLRQANAGLTHVNRELRESRARLVQSEMMSALGRMVAGIAHQVDAPLAYVKGALGVLEEQLAPLGHLAARCQDFAGLLRAAPHERGRLNQMLREIESHAGQALRQAAPAETGALFRNASQGVDQIAEAVLNLKNFSQIDRARVVRFPVEAALDSALALAQGILQEKQALVRREYGQTPPISGVPARIDQVFLNLITNAAQALPRRAEPNLITLRTAPEGEDAVRVEIEDNGAGIAQDALPRIFDPFFTTRPLGEGAGLGLPICFQIVQAHGGAIQVDSEPKVGTVFTVLLPVRAGPAAPETAAAAAGGQEVLDPHHLLPP